MSGLQWLFPQIGGHIKHLPLLFQRKYGRSATPERLLLMEVSLSLSLAGTIGEDGHRLLQRVYYEDTDFSGVVYHARYLHFLERGRTDYLRCLGITQGDVRMGDEEGLAAFVVRRMLIDFLAAARMDDVVEIRTSTRRVTGARLDLDQEIRAGDRLLLTAAVTVAVVNAAGRVRRLPDSLAALLAS